MDHGESLVARATSRGTAVTPERWQTIKAIFQAATELPPADRDAWLAAETAGDPDLRHEVTRMLRHADQGSLLDTPAWQRWQIEPVLTPGTHLGPYEIIREIGAGGMGRVYKARDTRLGRTVAIKVLNAEYSHRLQMEGRAVSALNHPHVCALYDIGDQDGTAYLVMEYIEGESLASRLARGPLPLDSVLRNGAEIASALAAAHAQGIVHRDLKPANIMVTATGVKVLDFGVARTAQDDEPVTGAVVGTVAYMSPSQWNGTPADTRSDIFALGLVLCEMATGVRPSREFPVRPANVPSAFAELIERCLQPDAARRIQRMEELRAALERLRSHAARPAASRRWANPAWIAVTLAAATMFVVNTWKTPTDPNPPPRPVVVIPSPELLPTPVAPRPKVRPVVFHRPPQPPLEPPSLGILASYPGMERDPSFSPDGSNVAFAWQRSRMDGFAIYVRAVHGDDPPAAVTSGKYEDWGPVWSPDGRRIAFRRRGGPSGIYWVSASGGPEMFLAPIGRVEQEMLPQMSWSRDGKWIAAPDRDSSGATHINLIAVRNGEKRELTSNYSGMDHAPAFSVDGKSLAYASCRAGASMCDVYVIDLDTDLKPKGGRRITDQRLYLRGIAWAPDRTSIVYSAGLTKSTNTSLYRVAANPPGMPVRIDLAGSDARHPTVAPTSDLLAYTRLNTWNLMMIRNFR
jgi:serine/threonine protein kinase